MKTIVTIIPYLVNNYFVLIFPYIKMYADKLCLISWWQGVEILNDKSIIFVYASKVNCGNVDNFECTIYFYEICQINKILN